jgi:hypothetical protein
MNHTKESTIVLLSYYSFRTRILARLFAPTFMLYGLTIPTVMNHTRYEAKLGDRIDL